MQVPSTDGRSVCLCWEHSKPKGPKGAVYQRLHWGAGSLRSFAAIRKEAGPFRRSFIRKGEVLACVGLTQTLKELKDLQGYLAHKKTPTPLGPPEDPGPRPAVGSQSVTVSYERGTSVMDPHLRIIPQTLVTEGSYWMIGITMVYDSIRTGTWHTCAPVNI